MIPRYYIVSIIPSGPLTSCQGHFMMLLLGMTLFVVSMDGFVSSAESPIPLVVGFIHGLHIG